MTDKLKELLDDPLDYSSYTIEECKIVKAEVLRAEREIERLQIIGQETAAELGAEIDALEAEVAERTADWKEATAKNRELNAQLITTIGQQIEQEPVAWLITSPDGDNLAQVHKPTALLSNETAVPLFAYHLPPSLTTIADAAKAVVDRWDTPLWKDVPATAEFIADLRNALEGVE